MNAEELYELTGQEIKQREEEGCNIAAMRSRHANAADLEDNQKQAMCRAVLEALDSLSGDAKYVEPSGLDEIRAERPDGPRQMQNVFSTEDLFNRIYGGWLGRCAGCMLGQPVEGERRENIRRAAELDGNYPIKDYFAPITRRVGTRSARLRMGNPALRGNIRGAPRDDDLDYTLTGLLLLEQHGFEFTTEDVAAFWLRNLPFHKVYTAERVAYRNLVDGVEPVRAGEVLNPCREWIGAQIRADAFGYVSPGSPVQAAELAYRDAYLSHRKNGIYGEMFVAAMIAAAFVEKDMEKIIRVGLSEIPKASRLTEAVERVVQWWDDWKDWERVADRIDQHYGNLQGCHTITNAAIVILGLLAGTEDFTTGLGTAVMPGYDTDCNGATVGSILGVRAGADKLPPHWIDPLEDTLRTIIASVHEVSISELTRRTLKVAMRQLSRWERDASDAPLIWTTGG